VDIRQYWLVVTIIGGLLFGSIVVGLSMMAISYTAAVGGLLAWLAQL
jgi:hypothetical protein